MTGKEFSQWRAFMKLNKVSTARVLGVGRNTILAYENSEKVPAHIELACAALACNIHSWKAVKTGEIVTLRRSELEQLTERFETENSDSYDEWREHVKVTGVLTSPIRRRMKATP